MSLELKFKADCGANLRMVQDLRSSKFTPNFPLSDWWVISKVLH